MNVRDLIEQLENCNPDAEVMIASQPRNPVGYYAEEFIVQSEEWGTVYIGESSRRDDDVLPVSVRLELGWS